MQLIYINDNPQTIVPFPITIRAPLCKVTLCLLTLTMRNKQHPAATIYFDGKFFNLSLFVFVSPSSWEITSSQFKLVLFIDSFYFMLSESFVFPQHLLPFQFAECSVLGKKILKFRHSLLGLIKYMQCFLNKMFPLQMQKRFIFVSWQNCFCFMLSQSWIKSELESQCHIEGSFLT